ncbi:hypothetical protein OIDMADRAFT_130283 [Oidiodendron maius Zn]|uniref:Major facilitator superfamily (MFS) profile domain-containing protein n=1 Tax=Oidiodendron maius (strain Zn) TaxID=913774 RepID=A0A0C3H1D7_OIDMZ|nr:hypothetical protein OIDMADRAFT_130283 [Oidiodendron maius Zn]
MDAISKPFSKHESRDLSGSVFLISGDGKMLRLPMPSTSPRDPLNWTGKKRACALLALLFFASFGLVETQAISLLLPALQQEYTAKFLLILIDLTFVAERPHVIAMFWALPSAISCLILPAIPRMASAGGWRMFYKISVIPSATAVLLAFVFFPETYFQRPAVAFDGHVLVQSATEKVNVYDGWEDVPGGKPLPERPERSRFVAILKMLKPWGWQRGGWKAMGACYIQIAYCILNPLVLWATILNAATFGGMVCVSATYANVLEAQPYSLDIHTIALINFGAAAGAFLAWPASGLMISRICRRLTVRNGGVRDAEQYLSAFVLPVLAGTVSLGLYGLAVERYWNWKWIILFWGINEFSCVTLFTATTLWVTEAFPRWAAAALVVVGCGSYVTSFGLSFLTLPWIKSQGFARAYIEMGVIVLAVGCLGIPIAFLGKNFRLRVNCRWAMSEGGSLRPQAGEP